MKCCALQYCRFAARCTILPPSTGSLVRSRALISCYLSFTYCSQHRLCTVPPNWPYSAHEAEACRHHRRQEHGIEHLHVMAEARATGSVNPIVSHIHARNSIPIMVVQTFSCRYICWPYEGRLGDSSTPLIHCRARRRMAP
jgi:hypothetical protein